MTWLQVHRGEAPVLICFPHTGTDIPPDIASHMHAPWRARKDTDWWIDRLYDFAPGLGVTTIRTAISRSVIDVNRDPSGASLYPGQATTGLCPTETFDGEPLYLSGLEPNDDDIQRRLTTWFAPYHDTIAAEIERVWARHGVVVLYDAHSIRSHIPRLFEGELPQFNIGTNSGQSCASRLIQQVETACRQSAYSTVVDGRFKGGWTTRHYGRPSDGIHAIQMELAIRGYLNEPSEIREGMWPPSYAEDRAAPLRAVLTDIIQSVLTFAKSESLSA